MKKLMKEKKERRRECLTAHRQLRRIDCDLTASSAEKKTWRKGGNQDNEEGKMWGQRKDSRKSGA